VNRKKCIQNTSVCV